MDLIDTHGASFAPGRGLPGHVHDQPSVRPGRRLGGLELEVQDSAIDYLAGPTVIQTYDVADGNGAVQTVTITITGDNDAAQITSAVQSGDAEEDSGGYGASGTSASPTWT